MGELIRIDEKNKVDGRELYEFLQVKTPYTIWFERMCEYGFMENVDFWTANKNVIRVDGVEMPQKKIDHELTISMAKELCMIQRTERGKQARLYFIECEKRLKAMQAPSYQISDPIERAKAWIKEQEQLKQLAAQNEEMQPKALFADAVSSSHTSILIRDLAKLIKQNGVDIGQNRLYAWLRKKGYLIKSGSDKNMPTQKAMEMKLFEVKEGNYIDGSGRNCITRTTKVTGKGQVYFVNKLLAGKE